MIGWGRLPDARDEHQGSSRESGDEAEDTDEGEQWRSERREGAYFGVWQDCDGEEGELQGENPRIAHGTRRPLGEKHHRR